MDGKVKKDNLINLFFKSLNWVGGGNIHNIWPWSQYHFRHKHNGSQVKEDWCHPANVKEWSKSWKYLRDFNLIGVYINDDYSLWLDPWQPGSTSVWVRLACSQKYMMKAPEYPLPHDPKPDYNWASHMFHDSLADLDNFIPIFYHILLAATDISCRVYWV